MSSRPETLIAALFMVALSTSPALADQIDGEWCSPRGGRIVVDGSNVTTPSGASVKANHSRHHVDFDIPAGEESAGDHFSADQLSDNEIQVTISHNTSAKPVTQEIWTKHCGVTS